MMRHNLAFPITLASAMMACSPTGPAKQPDPEPDWRRHTFDGLAPLMPIAQIKAALAKRGYRAERCASDERPADPAALGLDEKIQCYESTRTGWKVGLHFVQTPERPLLANLFFRTKLLGTDDQEDRSLREAARTFHARVRKHFGSPDTTTRTGDIETSYWHVPGGSKALPDRISVSTGGSETPNLRMTSFWAYRYQAAPPTETTAKDAVAKP